MFSHCSQSIQEFINFLGVHGVPPIWVNVYSAPPIFKNREWRNFKDIVESRPRTYPSILLIQEAQTHGSEEKPTNWQGKPMDSRIIHPKAIRMDHEKARNIGLQLIQKQLAKGHHYV